MGKISIPLKLCSERQGCTKKKKFSVENGKRGCILVTLKYASPVFVLLNWHHSTRAGKPKTPNPNQDVQDTRYLATVVYWFENVFLWTVSWSWICVPYPEGSWWMRWVVDRLAKLERPLSWTLVGLFVTAQNSLFKSVWMDVQYNCVCVCVCVCARARIPVWISVCAHAKILAWVFFQPKIVEIERTFWSGLWWCKWDIQGRVLKGPEAVLFFSWCEWLCRWCLVCSWGFRHNGSVL